MRGSIELDLQIFEDKKDFFSTKLAKLNNIEENLQLKSDEEERAGKDEEERAGNNEEERAGKDEEERAGKDINKGLLDLEQGNIITRLSKTLVWNFFYRFQSFQLRPAINLPVVMSIITIIISICLICVHCA